MVYPEPSLTLITLRGSPLDAGAHNMNRLTRIAAAMVVSLACAVASAQTPSKAGEKKNAPAAGSPEALVAALNGYALQSLLDPDFDVATHAERLVAEVAPAG